MIARLILLVRIALAERAFRWNRREAAYHDRQKVLHRNASSEYRTRARHYEAEAARLRMRLDEPREPLVKRVEV